MPAFFVLVLIASNVLDVFAQMATKFSNFSYMVNREPALDISHGLINRYHFFQCEQIETE